MSSARPLSRRTARQVRRLGRFRLIVLAACLVLGLLVGLLWGVTSG